jgi:hypothetical protein
VSPLWRDEVAIYLAPGRVALARRGRGLRPSVVSATDARVTAPGATDVAPTLGVLGRLLAEEGWQDADARVIVADAWARFALVPWSNAWLDSDERRGQAQYALTDAFGEVICDWSVALGEPFPGRTNIACALRPDILAGLDALLPAARLRLASLRPQLVCSFNVWRRTLPPDAWFVSLDEDSLAAVHLTGGGWDRVHTVRSGNWALELRRLQAFGRLAGGEPPAERMFVDAPPWLRRAAPADLTGIDWLDDRAVSTGESYELGLLQRTFA